MPLTRNREVAMEQEAVEGVAETIDASDAQFNSEEPVATFTYDPIIRNPSRVHTSNLNHIPGPASIQIVGRTEIVGGGATTTKPPLVDLLLASGHGEFTVNSIELTAAPTGTFIPGEKFTDGSTKIGAVVDVDDDTLYYAHISGSAFAGADNLTGAQSGATATVHGTPALTARGFAYRPRDPENSPSFTSHCNHDGKVFKARGSRSTGTISCEGAGLLAYFNYDLMGAAAGAPADGAMFGGAITWPTVLPESFKLGRVEHDGDAICIDGFTFDMGITLDRKPCANAEEGTLAYRISPNRTPTLVFEPDAELEATKNYFTQYAAGTTFNVALTIGQTATKRCRICIPKAQHTAITSGDRNGTETYQITMAPRVADQATGHDEYLIAFY